MEVAGKETILESPDLAKSLLNVSGFSMTRKGGGGSEILYRSQGAGRLLIFIDNSLLQGGCGGRMDTAITYISPENYRSVRIIKGPQDVRFGALISGAVLFDRDILRLSQTTFSGNLNVLYGSFDRRETSVNLLGGNELGSLQATGEHQLNMQAFYHEIDHVMDNFSLRPNINSATSYMYNNPKKRDKRHQGRGSFKFWRYHRIYRCII